MIDYGFYIKCSPIDRSAYKIGIFAMKHADVRIGGYQNSFGPTYKERFEHIWVGTQADIRELERLLKIKFRNKIAGNMRGYTEWVQDITYEELVNEINTLIHGLGINVINPEKHTQIFESDLVMIKNMYLTSD